MAPLSSRSVTLITHLISHLWLDAIYDGCPPGLEQTGILLVLWSERCALIPETVRRSTSELRAVKDVKRRFLSVIQNAINTFGAQIIRWGEFCLENRNKEGKVRKLS